MYKNTSLNIFRQEVKVSKMNLIMMLSIVSGAFHLTRKASLPQVTFT